MKYLFSGVLLISFAPILVRASNLSPLQAGFWRMFFGALFLLGLIIASKQSFKISPRLYPGLILAGVFFGCDLYLWHNCIHMIGPGLATLLANCQVFFVLGLGYLFFQEKLKQSTLLAVSGGIAGLWMIFGLSQGAHYPLMGLIMGGLSALAYAGFLLFLKHSVTQSESDNSLNQMLVICVSCALFMACLLGVRGELPYLPNLTQSGIMLAYGVVVQGMAWLWIAKGSQFVPAMQTSLLLLTQPALALIWDIFWFGHPVLWNEMLGVSVVLGAVFMGSQFQNKTASTRAPKSAT